MNTKEVLEIILTLCIGYMIYTMLFAREGHSVLSMAGLENVLQGVPTSEDVPDEEDEEYEEEDEDYDEAMDEDDDGLLEEPVGSPATVVSDGL